MGLFSRRHRPPAGSSRRAGRPWVLLDTECRRGAVSLVLVNIGDEPAYGVRVKFSPDVSGVDPERPVSKLRLFQGLSLLRPGRRIRVFVHAARLLYADPRPTTFSALVSYRDVDGHDYQEVFEHDLDVYRHLPEVTTTRQQREARRDRAE